MTAVLPDLPNPQSHDQPPGPTPWSNWVIPGQSGGKAEQQQGRAYGSKQTWLHWASLSAAAKAVQMLGPVLVSFAFCIRDEVGNVTAQSANHMSMACGATSAPADSVLRAPEQ